MSLKYKAKSRALLAVLLAGTAACSEENGNNNAGRDAGVPTTDAGTIGDDSSPVVLSEKARVKFKGGIRYARDLSTALDIPREELCLELGLYDCVDVAHGIALGGVEPYGLGVLEPLPDEGVATPIAIDRIALSACQSRVDRDFSNASDAKFFSDVAGLGTEGNEAILDASTNALYGALLGRPASSAEKKALREFFSEIVASATEQELKDFAALSCFAVATTMEALFY